MSFSAITGMVNKAQAAVAVFMMIKKIVADDELRQAAEIVLDALEEVFEAIPGDFPDSAIDSLQEALGFDDDDDDVE